MSDVYSRLRAFGDVIRAVRRDGWENTLTGLGTSRDKMMYGSFSPAPRISDYELSALYHHHHLSKRIVNIRPKEAFREGFKVEVKDDTDLAKEINQSITKLGLAHLFRDGQIWGRLYGGCLLIAGIDDGKEMSEPLEDDAEIRTIQYLLLLDKRYIYPATWYEDPSHPKYQQVETYGVMTPTGTMLESSVHESRCIRFGGAITDERERRANNSWDFSILQAIYDALRDGEQNWKAASTMMTDASQGVFKIKGLLASLLTPKGQETMATRMQIVDMARGVARSILLDADSNESYEKIPTQFAGVSDILDRSMMWTAAAAEIPVTLLFGRSAAGMNATGDADYRWFYDSIKGEQTQEVDPNLRRIIDWILRAKDGPTLGDVPEEYTICFPRLWQPTPLEAAQIRKLNAETDSIRIGDTVWTAAEVALSRAAGGDDAPVEIDEELRTIQNDNELELAKNGPIDPLAGLPAPGAKTPATPGLRGTPNGKPATGTPAKAAVRDPKKPK